MEDKFFFVLELKSDFLIFKLFLNSKVFNARVEKILSIRVGFLRLDLIGCCW